VSKQPTAKKKKRRNSQGWDVWRRLVRNKKAVAAMIVLVILLFLVIFANQLLPYSLATDLSRDRFQWPNMQHWFGTDKYGRDLFARIVYGARTSLFIGLTATVFSATIGTIIGTASAYIGGKFDYVVTRILDIWMAIPALLVTLAIIAGLGVGLKTTIFALAFGGIPGFARTLRGVALGVTSMDYMEAVRALGATHRRAILKHVIPNVASQVLVQITMNISGNILMCAYLGFLGLGAQPPTPEWGSIMAEGLEDYEKFSYIVSIPGATIAVTTLAINILGDALRDALDPRLK
jgi:peptide/nickel transport system permease protein